MQILIQRKQSRELTKTKPKEETNWNTQVLLLYYMENERIWFGFSYFLLHRPEKKVHFSATQVALGVTQSNTKTPGQKSQLLKFNSAPAMPYYVSHSS